MRYTTLGRSGLHVSRACLGTMNFGTDPRAPTAETEARRIVDAFLDAGHNLIDTADTYRCGTSEEVVGRAVADRRAEVVLATKAAAPQGAGPNDRGLSRAHLTRALEASLRRLGTASSPTAHWAAACSPAGTSAAPHRPPDRGSRNGPRCPARRRAHS
jgi:aryl-alcohol dehydrogenase-like predicted oxidoreductase